MIVTDEEYRKLANDLYSGWNIELDEYAKIRREQAGEGAWVAAWVWVDVPEQEEEEGDPS